MKTYRITTLIFSFIFIMGCSNSPDENAAKSTANTPAISADDLSQGFKLLETNCFSCHSPNASIDNRIAPPMEAIKKHYLDEGQGLEQFTSDLISFLNKPSKEKSKMPNAVKKFGVMPTMNFADEQIAAIAKYIYSVELEKPEWFEKHYQEEKQKYSKTFKELTPIQEGQNYAMQTKGVLGKNLLNAINTRGTEHALSFCSTKAIPLTDSMSLALNANIERVSDNNRNPNNKANDQELEYILSAKKSLAAGEEIKPVINEIGGKLVGYYPITTNKMCLQCHGQPGSEILPETQSKIAELYPNDKAVNYGVNELRGIWVVEMDEK